MAKKGDKTKGKEAKNKSPYAGFHRRIISAHSQESAHIPPGFEEESSAQTPEHIEDSPPDYHEIHEEVHEHDEDSHPNDEYAGYHVVEEVEEIIYEAPTIAPEKKGLDIIEHSDSARQQLERIQTEGAEKARQIDDVEAFSNTALVIVKFFATVTILVILIGSTAFFIKYSFDKIEEEEAKAEAAASSTDSSETVRSVQFKWRLPNSKANNLVKDFYTTVGTLNSFAAIVDMMFIGVLDFQGAKISFYCIKKRDGRCFLRLGEDASMVCYFIDVRGKVWLLKQGGMAGEREKLNPLESERIRMLVTFDEEINRRAFPSEAEQELVTDSRIDYEGTVLLDKMETETISTLDSEGRRNVYYIDPATKYIVAESVIAGENKFMLKFSNYKSFETDILFPENRSIFVNNKFYAEVKLTRVQKNREMMFPQQ